MYGSVRGRVRLPLFALVGVTAIWGVTFVQVQDALALYPLFAFLAVRFAISTVALAPFAWGALRSLPREGYVAGIGVGVLLAAAYGLQTAGLELTTVASTGFITGLYVVFTPLLARERARPRECGVPVVPDHRDGEACASVRPARPDVPADGYVVRCVHRHRRLPGRAPNAARGDGLGSAPRHRALRRRARLPHRDAGPGADDSPARGARWFARDADRSRSALGVPLRCDDSVRSDRLEDGGRPRGRNALHDSPRPRRHGCRHKRSRGMGSPKAGGG